MTNKQCRQYQKCQEHQQSNTTTAQQRKMMKNHFVQTESQIGI